MSGLGMWKCPNCETLNDGNFCHVCRTPRPQMGNPPGQNAEGGKNKGLLIALVAIVAVLLIVIAIFVGYTLMNRDDVSVTENSSAAVTEVIPDEQIFYVNKFDDSGIYVRSGPGKNYGKILYIEKGDQTVHLRYLNEKAKGDDNWFWYHVETPSGDVGYVREDVVVKWEKE